MQRCQTQPVTTAPCPLIPTAPCPVTSLHAACRLIQGLRPWIAAPCSLLLCTATDRLGIHRAMLITCFVLSTLFRSTLAIVPESISLVAAVILAAEAIGAPVGVIADASVVAKCKQDGDYGKQR